MQNLSNFSFRLGILGGMGPMATAYLYEQIIKATPVRTDQDHLEIIIASLPKIPDRTKALLENDEDPLPQLKAGVQLLLDAQATHIVIPCNTAHAFLPRLQQAINFHCVDMIEATRQKIEELKLAKIGLLATTGTIQTGLYEKYLQRTAQLIYPNQEMQLEVMDIIYGKNGVKAGNLSEENQHRLIKCINELSNQGAQAVILGCTELPLLITQKKTRITLIEPMQVVAEKIVVLTKELN